METLYDVLEISPHATMGEIKKAYFKMIRKYPPDDYPKEFMSIREAYETLSNEKTRKEYDALATMPQGARQSFQFAKEALQQGNIKDAIKLLENSVNWNPNVLMIQGLLGEAYLRNGNCVKAAKILGKLVELAPDNAAFAGHYAQACLDSNWYKKALVGFKKAIALDEDNISLWTGLANAYIDGDDLENAQATLLTALKKGRAKGWDELNLLMHLVSTDAQLEDNPSLCAHLDRIVTLVEERQELKDKIAKGLAIMAFDFKNYGYHEEAYSIICRAAQISPDDEKLQALESYMEHDACLAKQLDDLHKDPVAQSESGSFIYNYLIPANFADSDPGEHLAMDTLSELSILENFPDFKDIILYVKATYPELYATKKDFFDKALRPQSRKVMLERLLRDKKTQHLISDYIDDDEMEEPIPVLEPIVRDGPKIGRNDPCPCGSGKKYKKCCGR